jgi:uncharacterized Zn finger protein
MSWRYYDDEYDEEDYSYDDEYDDFEDEDCDEHPTPLDAVVIDGPIRARNKRGNFGTTWWGQKFSAAVEQFYQDQRLQRGRTYARNGSVQRLEISGGAAFAPVQGSRPMPYCVDVTMKKLTDAEWKKALNKLSGQALYAAKLLAGEMPADIEAIFQSAGLSLFPRNLKELAFRCSCPDYGNPCKHGAAVYYLLVEQIDADPFVLFHLRGKTREQVLSMLRIMRGSAEPERQQVLEMETSTQPGEPLDQDLEAFWTSPEPLPAQGVPEIPTRPPLLRALGDPPGLIANDLEAMYKAVSLEAYQWLGL